MDFSSIVGDSAGVRHALHMAKRVATSPLRVVLLAGEAGTGKELLARCIHNAGHYADAPFVAIGCSSLPEALLEVELFGQDPPPMRPPGAMDGHGTINQLGGSRKAGVLELVGRGTVFLDDVSELPRAAQGRLLRALEEYHIRREGALAEIPVQCRVIAATKARLEERAAAGAFREDLLVRLSSIRIELPPLRERGDDVQAIARHFLAEIARSQGAARRELGLDAVTAMRKHRWPGNVRELKRVVEHAALLCEGEVIGAGDLMIQQRRAQSASAPGATGFGEIRIPASGKRLRDVEREALQLTLQLTNFNQSAAARILCISRPTLARKIRQYGLDGVRDLSA